MPPFITAPPAITPRRGLQEGLPGYSAGSFAIGQAPTRMYVTSVAIAANVVTLGVKIVEGNIPAVGSLISVTGTVVGTAAVNVTRVALASVTIVAATGVGTVTYAATAANLATTPDGGMAIVDVPQIGDTLAVQKYLQFALPQPAGPAPETGRVVTWSWACPSAPATIALQLEGAVDDNDSEYVIIGSSQTTVNGTVIGNVPIAIRFLRVNVTAFTGGASPTIWAKLLI
jgi:hypothetical protein